MEVHVLLADKGTNNVPQGTLNLLNLGWVVAHSDGKITPPHAVAIFFEAELADCNRSLKIEIALLDDDGKVVELPGPAGPQPLRLEQTMTISPPGGAPTGTPGKANTLLEMHPGLPLGPGLYRWRVKVDGRGKDEWTTRFYVAAPPTMPSFGALAT